jgi:hypothetical protein
MIFWSELSNAKQMHFCVFIMHAFTGGKIVTYFQARSRSNWVFEKSGQWTMDSGQWMIASLSTHRLSHAQASFPTSHTVVFYEVNLVYLGRVDN